MSSLCLCVFSNRVNFPIYKDNVHRFFFRIGCMGLEFYWIVHADFNVILFGDLKQKLINDRTEHSLILSREGLILTLSILSCPQGWISWSIPVDGLMMRRMSVFHQNSGGIEKSIPSALEISLDTGESLGSREISWDSGLNFPIPPSFWWSTDTLCMYCVYVYIYGYGPSRWPLYWLYVYKWTCVICEIVYAYMCMVYTYIHCLTRVYT